MAEKIGAVLDAGPYIHLREIEALEAFKIFKLSVPKAVEDELKILKGIRYKIIAAKNKNFVDVIANQYSLGMGEAEAIALCSENKISILLTDDLDARTTAKSLGLEPHGTIGILLRAYKNKIFTKKETVEFVKKLENQSTIYITKELVQYILNELEEG